jgi:hypothetical protein
MAIDDHSRVARADIRDDMVAAGTGLMQLPPSLWWRHER